MADLYRESFNRIENTSNLEQLGVLAFIPFQPAANYMSLTLRNLGYTVFEANMLAIPGFFLFFINVSSSSISTYLAYWVSDSRCYVVERKISRKTPLLVA
jgi:hypothetical protein